MKKEKGTVEERQLLQMKIQTGILVFILVLLFAFVAVILVQVNDVVTQIKQIDLNAVNGAIQAVQDVAEELSDIDMHAVNEGIAALGGAAGNLQNLDMGALNKVVGSLTAVAEKLEKITSIFH